MKIIEANCLILLALFIDVQGEESAVSGEDYNLVAKYLAGYNGFQRPLVTAESSSGGANGKNPKKRLFFANTPAFKEGVVQVQQEHELPQTGVVDNDVVQAIKKPRCGMAEQPSGGNLIATYTEVSRWRRNNGGLYELSYIFLSSTFPAALHMEKGILSAMCLWELNSNVRFHQHHDQSKQADVIVSFAKGDHGDGFPFDGTGRTLAHAFYPENGLLHFDSDEQWILLTTSGGSNSRKKDVFTVALHELGHTLGLGHSRVKGSLMLPVYAYTNPYNEYILRGDDVEGISALYGAKLRGADPSTDPKSACSVLLSNYKVKLSPQTFVPNSNRFNPRPTTTTTTTRTTTTTTTPYEPNTSDCQDDKTLGIDCDGWAELGLCMDPLQGPSMSRVCRRTCGFCAVVLNQKPSILPPHPKTICDIGEFDSFTTMYDHNNVYHAYVIKEDYYFPLKVRIRVSHVPVTLLNESSLNGDFTWDFDPKLAPPNVYRYKRDGFLEHSKGISTLVWAKNYFLAFTERGTVDEYQRNGPSIRFIGSTPVSTLFPGYPHPLVDAAFIESSGGQTSCILFYQDKFWRFKERLSNSELGVSELRSFALVSPQDGANIAEWHGVAACGLDAVFAYQGIPYFLKGTTFWPATDSQPLVYRDVTYYFFRCWQTTPSTKVIHAQCSSMQYRFSFPLTFVLFGISLLLH